MNQMHAAGLRIARENALLTLTIDRQDRRNALDAATYTALTEQIALASADKTLAAVILTGAGDHFTAGNDLRDFQTEHHAGALAGLTFLRTLSCAEVPVIAAVEGNAVGIGVTLLLHCDFVYIGEGAALRLPFVALGLCPEGASSMLLPRLAGARKSARWLLEGKVFGAAEACEAGLATAVTATGQALAAAEATAANLIQQPPAALRLTKAMLKRPDRQAIQETLDYEAEQFDARLKTEEAQAAFARFFKK